MDQVNRSTLPKQVQDMRAFGAQFGHGDVVHMLLNIHLNVHTCQGMWVTVEWAYGFEIQECDGVGKDWHRD